MLNVHPSLLPRWRGAAPIERAIMAGDAATGVCVMRLTEGLDSGPVALREEIAIGAEDDFETSPRGSRRLGGELLVQALDLLEEGRPRVRRAGRRAATYAEKIDPAERRLDPAAPGERAGPNGPRPHPARRRLPRDRRRRAARGAAGAAGRRRRSARGDPRRVGGAAARLRTRDPAARGGAAPGGKPMAADAYLRGTAAATLIAQRASVHLGFLAQRAEARGAAVITEARAVALEVDTHTFHVSRSSKLF